MLSSPYQQVPSRRTDQIIGRKEPLKAIYNAIKDKGRTWLLYFYGPGGIGKTRLLEEVVTKEGVWDDLTFRSTTILDMYHSDYQSSDGIRHGIVLGLEGNGADFQEYHAKRNELEKKQREGTSSGELKRLQEEVERAFHRGYQTLAKTHRLVICLDTLELMQHESDPVQTICQVETVDALVMNWLVEQLPALPNTVILMAGRPENRERIEATFEEKFFAEDNSFDAQPLAAFSLKETQKYLEAISQKLEEDGDVSLAEILQGYEGLDKQFHRVTNGRPVYLALIVDLFLTQSEGSRQFVNDILNGREFEEDELAMQLIDNLRELPDPHGRIIQYLFNARKGLTADLLDYFGEGNIEEVKAHLQWLGRLAIVKVRAVGEGELQQKTFFFHDEIYNMYDLYFKDDPREFEKYKPFVSYHRQKLGGETDAIRREKLTIDRLFYEMRLNPYNGYHRYYSRWDHDAIKGHENDYDMRLRNETLGFLNRYVDPQSPFYDKLIASKVNRNDIDRDCAVRWVRRHWARGSVYTARQVAEDLRDVVKYLQTHNIVGEKAQYYLGLFDWDAINDPLYKADLLTATGEAMVQKATPVQEAEKVLNDAISILENIDSTSLEDAQKQRYHQIFGLAHNRLGYLYRTAGRYGLALRHYRLALHHFDEANIRSELATTLTNTAYLLALQSRSNEAQQLIMRAVRIREEIQKLENRKYPLLLTRSAKSRIFTLGGHPDWGVREAREALQQMEALADPRGVGLCRLSLGFCLRKQADQWKVDGCTKEEAEQSFKVGRQILERAASVFTDEVDEPMRLWEANNELGSLFCDWAWLVRSQSDGYQRALNLYADSIRYQKIAENLAKMHTLESQTLDSLDDLAQAYGDRSILFIQIDDPETAKQDRNRAEAYFDEIDSAIDARFKLVAGQGFVAETGSGEGEAQWLAMGKQHLWRGIWLFRDVEYQQVSETERETVLEKATENLFLSIVYFSRYWLASFDRERAVGYLTRFLPDAGIKLAWAQKQVQAVEQKYAIQLPTLHDLVNQTLLF